MLNAGVFTASLCGLCLQNKTIMSLVSCSNVTIGISTAIWAQVNANGLLGTGINNGMLAFWGLAVILFMKRAKDSVPMYLVTPQPTVAVDLPEKSDTVQN